MLTYFLPGVTGSFLEVFLLAFSALFAIVNPILNALIFADITADRPHAERLQLARRVGLYSFVLLVFSIWAVSYVLNFFGITLGALQVAGGLTIAAGAWRILHAPERQEAMKESQALRDGRSISARNVNDIAFFPMSIPFSVGPGAISVSITLGVARPGASLDIPFMFGVSIAALVVAGIITILFRYAGLLARALGPRGSAAVRQIVALLLIAIGVQIMAIGMQDELVPFLHEAAAHLH